MKICAVLVPTFLTGDQKKRRLDNVITGNETWVFEYDLEIKRQWAEGHTKASPRLKDGPLKQMASEINALLLTLRGSSFILSPCKPFPPLQTRNLLTK